MIIILPSCFVGAGAYTVTAVVVAGLVGYAYIRWKVNFGSSAVLDPASVYYAILILNSYLQLQIMMNVST
jgi:hypothetical protein